jgi:hypothetical protein
MDKARLDELKALKKQGKDKAKNKDFKNLSSKEKDELLEIALKMLGII